MIFQADLGLIFVQDYFRIMMFTKKSNLSYQEVLDKLMRYCSYQERSVFELRQKLREYVLSEVEKEELIEYLLIENFVNEERFVAVFVRSKVNVKKWGRYKIIEGLKLKGIGAELVTNSISAIDKAQYIRNFEDLLEKKIKSISASKEDSAKLYRYLLSKGYESDLIVNSLKKKGLM